MPMSIGNRPRESQRVAGDVQHPMAAFDDPVTAATQRGRGELQRAELEALLATEPSSRRLVAQLRERCSDPVQALIAVLDQPPCPDATPAALCSDRERLDVPRRAFEALIALGTVSAYRCVLSRLELFDWELHRDLEDVIAQRADEIRAAAAHVWPALGWIARARLVVFLDLHGLLDDAFLDRALAANPQAMTEPELLGYLEALGNFFDRRALPRILAILDDALASPPAPDRRAARRIAVALRQLGKLDVVPTPEQRRLAQVHGVRGGR